METDNFEFTLGTYAPQKDLNYRHEQPNYSFYYRYCSRSNAAIVLRSVEIFLAFHSFYIGHLKLSRFRTS